MQLNSKLFKACDYFQIRIPAYPIEKIELVNFENILDVFKHDVYFQEAIFYANPQLYHKAMSNSFDKRSLGENKVNRPLINYYRRMITRATPMGLFVGVNNGTISGKFKYNNDWVLKRHYEVGNSWLYSLIHELTKEKELLSKFTLKSNPDTYIKNGRLYLFYNDKINAPDEQSITSIRISEPISDALRWCNEPISGGELLNKMIQIHGEENKAEIINLVCGLIDNSFLLTNLEKPFITIDQVIDFLSSAGYTKNITSLKIVKKMIRDINQENYDNIEQLNILVSQMDKIVKVTKPLQQNMTIDNLNISIDDSLSLALEEAFSWLWFNGGKIKYTDRLKYYSKFVDLFGENTRVPLLDAFMRLPFNENTFEIENENTDYLKKAVLDALINKEYYVLIQDQSNDTEVYKEEVPDLEIYGRVIALNNKPNSLGFVTNTFMLNDTIGGTFGRFLAEDSDVSVSEKLKEYYKETGLGLMFNSKNDSWKNILLGSNIINDSIFLNYFTETSESLSQLYIVAHNKKFYIWSEKKKDYVNLVKLDMLNQDLMPSILRYILNLQRYNCSRFNYKVFSNFDKYPFCPRIQYNNIVLRSATWFISYKYSTVKGWKEFFNDFKIKYNLKKYVNYVVRDRKLLINTDDDYDIMYLGEIVKKNKEILLEEIVGLNSCILNKDGHYYMNEIVIPLKGKMRMYPIHSYQWKDNYFMPTNQYLYYSLYLEKMDMDVVLLNELFPLCSKVIEQGMAKDYFFIRYYDHDYHLRIRFRGNTIGLNHLINAINSWSEKLYEKKLINNVTINIYRPEINRYGGDKYFKYVEDFFCRDSIFVIKLLRLIKENDNPEEYCMDVIVTYSFISLLKTMNFSYSELIKYIDLENTDNKSLVDYHNKKKTLLNYFSDKTNKYINSIRKLVRDRDEGSELYRLMEKQDTKEVFNIVSSILHMTCNRISLMDSSLEIRTRECLRCFLRDLKYWRDLRW